MHLCVSLPFVFQIVTSLGLVGTPSGGQLFIEEYRNTKGITALGFSLRFLFFNVVLF